jgi:hypothetical protein
MSLLAPERHQNYTPPTAPGVLVAEVSDNQFSVPVITGYQDRQLAQALTAPVEALPDASVTLDATTRVGNIAARSVLGEEGFEQPLAFDSPKSVSAPGRRLLPGWLRKNVRTADEALANLGPETPMDPADKDFETRAREYVKRGAELLERADLPSFKPRYRSRDELLAHPVHDRTQYLPLADPAFRPMTYATGVFGRDMSTVRQRLAPEDVTFIPANPEQG